ncbi:Response regulator receiver domain-containing protein [Mucilaginibacter lappiensis]|uniref:Two-component SAPR family response regulator n=1 Tax=Mucilaginibacter lappiensis TaxID=354630 RepID=A0ABR6PG28_9SPHI|nr:response regulator [Mucilaginibacter lappiensis]MBB6108697.1 two-component SAPR family response regulator [Mucilaginibacter lappiensis]SIQ27390.1 Response regulator receiver domain-containing protein [Mucilaginibacter lappiensis]
MLTCIGIDDEEYNNEYLKHCCSNIPFVKLIATFTEPFAARALLSSGEIDLVFLDFNLIGITAAEFIKELPLTVKVIIVSSEMEGRIRDYDMDIITIVSKPYPCERLLEACKLAAKMQFKKRSKK